MNPRTIRRAIDRKARKQARKNEAANSLPVAPGSFAGLPLNDEGDAAEVNAIPSRAASRAQLEANRRNAALSTGPVTAAGKSSASKNALKTGLTGHTVLLANEDAEIYDQHLQTFFQDLQPAGDRETELVQSIADSKWRLARVPSLEFGIYALGRIQFAEEFQHLAKAEAAALIEARTFLAYQRQLNNLSIQECRLRRQCEKDTAELNRLQQLRAAAERAAAARAVQPQTLHHPQEIGFVFAAPDSAALMDASADPLALPQAA